MSVRLFFLSLLALSHFAGANPIDTREDPAALEKRADYSGDGTFYATGLGACGITNNDSQFIAAVSHSLFDTYPGYKGGNPNKNPICGKKATVTYGGKTIVVTLTDRCVACKYGDLDFSPAAFDKLANPAVGRIHGIKWHINGSSAPAPAKPAPKPKPKASTSGCTKYVTAAKGTTCDALDKKYGVSLSKFLSLNKEVHSNCNNLQVGKAYCVKN